MPSPAKSQPPTTAEFATLHDQLLIGVPLEEGLEALGQRTGLAGISVLRDRGGIAGTDRRRAVGGAGEPRRGDPPPHRRCRAEATRYRSEARTSAIVLAVMPVLTGAMMWVINPSYIDLLFHDPTGKSLLGAAVLSLAIGVFAMRAIIRKTLA